MKYINKIFSLFAIALMAVACDPDAESYTPGGLEEGNQGICFAGNYTQTVEVEPGVTSFILTLKRSVTDAAGSVDIKVLNNEENIFICPSTASFAAGEATTTLTVETPSATAGILYNLKLAVSGDNVSEYTSGYNEISVNFSIIKCIIRKTKCFDFGERNVLFPKTKRSFFRTPKHPLPCPFPLNFSLLIITKKFGNLAKNRYICIV